MKRTLSIAAAALAALALPAMAQAQTAPAAQAAAAPKAGDTVYDGAGAEVGKIENISSAGAVVFTGTTRATIPLDRFGTSPKGPTLGLTKAQLEAAMAGASSQLKAKLVPGAEVRGSDGAVLGTVKAATDQQVTLTAGGKDVNVPIAGIGATDQGLTMGLTSEQFQAAISTAQPPAQ
jgi:hypothetical protein